MNHLCHQSNLKLTKQTNQRGFIKALAKVKRYRQGCGGWSDNRGWGLQGPGQHAQKETAWPELCRSRLIQRPEAHYFDHSIQRWALTFTLWMLQKITSATIIWQWAKHTARLYRGEKHLFFPFLYKTMQCCYDGHNCIFIIICTARRCCIVPAYFTQCFSLCFCDNLLITHYCYFKMLDHS